MKSSPRPVMCLRALALFTISVLTIPTALAQAIDFGAGREPVVLLTGPWRFNAGDDPGWAAADFDDSRWSLLAAGQSWSEQGYSGYGGVGWYRLRVDLPPNPTALALYLPYVDSSCQVFANGRLIGSIGSLPPAPRFIIQYNSLFSIPPGDIPVGRPLELAIRVWLNPAFAGSAAGGLVTLPQLGDAAFLDNWRKLQIHDRFWRSAAREADVGINLFTALAGIGLFLLRRREREYLWWGISQLFWAAFAGISLYASFYPTHYTTAIIASEVVDFLAYFLQFVFYIVFLHQRPTGLFWTAALATLGARMVDLGLNFGLLRTNGGPPLSSMLSVLAQGCVVGILVIGEHRRERDVAFLLIPNSVMLACDALQTLASLPQLYAQPWAGWMRGFLSRLVTWPFSLSAFQLVGDLEMLAVLVILVRRYARSRQDEERLESELEAARAVQKVLIPNEIPAIPGFSVETVYQPAAQVGGDFFQIIPLPAGGALIAIGDVSGKGMPAAMTVSLLVGTLRTLAHYTHSPGEILTSMNRRMLARSQGGFTTCLVLRLDNDRTLTLANAGHIAPYLDGREIEIENGLPLGLAESGEYRETMLALQDQNQLTLLTDGVVEARRPGGELLGFERTRALSTQRAREVAQAAQSFGQEDDITVLTLSVASAPIPA
ncbi:hypothetical protein DYQ86_05520 [Acidobacteria bacterium AB60]|nr:hypothetical protein DYQ86_05520 [Acidobacteria bacterium AB60]